MAGTFNDELKKCMEFFKPENLEKLSIKLDDVAVLVIDVQREFCDSHGDRGNAETEEVSARIQSIIPAFRKAGIPVYAVYFSDEGALPADDVDFHKFRPAPEDTLVAKDNDSAFAGSDIGDLLRRDHKTKLLTCGFNLSACLKDTAEDALEEGFKVCVMKDLTGNDNYCPVNKNETFNDLTYDGAVVTTSQAVLTTLAYSRAAAP